MRMRNISKLTHVRVKLGDLYMAKKAARVIARSSISTLGPLRKVYRGRSGNKVSYKC